MKSITKERKGKIEQKIQRLKVKRDRFKECVVYYESKAEWLDLEIDNLEKTL